MGRTKGKRLRQAVGIFVSICLAVGIYVPSADAAEAAAAPKVVKAQMINSTDMELYWDQEVTGAGEEANFSITVDGKEDKIYSYTWPEYNYSETGIVYYNSYSLENPDALDAPKTSIRLTDEIADLENLPEIKVTIAGGKIKNAAGTYAEEQTVTVDRYEPFYTQEITLDCGVKILGSKNARADAMTKAEEMMEVILANEEIAKRMGEYGCMLGIYGEGEIAFDIPEHRFTYDESGLYVEGFGGTQLASIKDANVLRLTTGDYTTGYVDESVLTHEFAHTIKNYGLTEAQQQKVETVYNSAIASGKWANSYAGSNSDEYFATISAMWFNAMNDTEDGQWDGVRGPINTREELKAYDNAAYELLSEIYVSDQYLPEPWQNGSVPNNYEYTGTGTDVGGETDDSPYQRIASKASGTSYDSCIEVNSGLQTEGATVDIWWNFDENASLGWLFEKADGNYYKIKFYDSGLVLTPSGGSKEEGAAITIGKDTGADSQLWQVKKTSGDYALILNKASGLALSIQGDAVTEGNLIVQTAYTGEGSDYQQWKIYDASTKAVFTPEEAAEADKKALNDAITAAKALKEADYTADSWKKFSEALMAAQAVADKTDAAQEEVDAAAKELADAQAALVKAGSTDQPGGSTDQPGGNTDQPGGSTDQPGGSTDQPGGNADQPGANAAVKVSSVKFSAKTYKVLAGKKLDLSKKVTVSPSNAANKALKWAVSNTKYATVSAKGVVSAKAAGAGKTVTVTAAATDGSGKKATAKVKITDAVKKITLKAAKSVKAGKSVKVKAAVNTIKKKNAKVTLKWTVSNKKYATVSKKGVVKTKKAGAGKTVKVTAAATDGSGKKATWKIKIKK